jgi:hypothetical protein
MEGILRVFSYIAPYLFQIFSLMAIILPIAGGILALTILWRIMKSLERIGQSLAKLSEYKEQEPRKEKRENGT